MQSYHGEDICIIEVNEKTLKDIKKHEEYMCKLHEVDKTKTPFELCYRFLPKTPFKNVVAMSRSSFFNIYKDIILSDGNKLYKLIDSIIDDGDLRVLDIEYNEDLIRADGSTFVNMYASYPYGLMAKANIKPERQKIVASYIFRFYFNYDIVQDTPAINLKLLTDQMGEIKKREKI